MSGKVYNLSFGARVETPVVHVLRRGFTAAFVGPAGALAELVPAGPWTVSRVGGANSVAVVVYQDFADSPVGPYRQVSVAAPVMWGDSPGPPLVPLLWQGLRGTDRFFAGLGFVVVQIPVSSPEAVAYSAEVWGEPAWKAEFLVESGALGFSCTVLEGGREFLTVRVREGGWRGQEKKNYRLYSLRQGVALRETMRVEASVRMSLWPRAASLRAGDHPLAGFLEPFARRGFAMQSMVYGEGTVGFGGPEECGQWGGEKRPGERGKGGWDFR